MPNPFDPSPHGSLNWGANRIRQLLDREEREKRAHLMARSTPVETLQEDELQFPTGSSAWGTQRLRQLDAQNEAHAAGYDGADAPEAADEGESFEDYVAARAAISEMVGSQLPGRESGPADAYRHILWAGEMTRRFGEDYAREMLGLHELEGMVSGQSDNDNAMDVRNNEIGIQIGIGARTYDDVISAARKVIGGSAADGLGVWKPDYDPTSTMAPHAAQWLPQPQWRNNPSFDVPRHLADAFPPKELPTRLTNWYSNPIRPNGPDWQRGYIPDGYSYAYGSPQHATGSWPLWRWFTGPR